MGLDDGLCHAVARYEICTHLLNFISFGGDSPTFRFGTKLIFSSENSETMKLCETPILRSCNFETKSLRTQDSDTIDTLRLSGSETLILRLRNSKTLKL